MKRQHLILFTLLFSFFTQIVSGQNKPCNNFDCAYKKAENFLKQAAYQKALDNLDSAEGYLTDTNTKEKEQIKGLRRRLFVAIEKEKEDAKRARLESEKQKKEAEKQTIIANYERNNAVKVSRKAKSKELAAKALLLFVNKEEKDETVALCLAYHALKIDSTQEAKDVFEKILANPENQYYEKKVKGQIVGYSNDSTLFWTYDDDSSRLINWSGNIIGRAKGKIEGFYKDSVKFWTYDGDSTRLTNWKGENLAQVRGEIEGFYPDSIKFWTFYNGNSYLTDWKNSKLGLCKGHLYKIQQSSDNFQQSSNKFWTYNNPHFQIDNSILTGWDNKVLNNLNGSIYAFNNDLSCFLINNSGLSFRYNMKTDSSTTFSYLSKGISSYTLQYDTIKIFNYDNIKLYQDFGALIKISDNNSLIWIFHKDSTKVINWKGELKKVYKGYATGINIDSTRYWTFYDDSLRLIDSKGFIYAKVKGFFETCNIDSSLFLTYDFDSTRISDLYGHIINTVSIQSNRGFPNIIFNKDSSFMFTSSFDSTQILGWSTQKYPLIYGRVVNFDKKRNIFWSNTNDSLLFTNLNKDVLKRFRGEYGQINNDSTKIWLHYSGTSKLFDCKLQMPILIKLTTLKISKA